MRNVLVFGSCRLNFNLNKYNLNRPKNIKYIHSHYEIVDIINSLQNNLLHENTLTKLSKIIYKNDVKNILFNQIEINDIILIEICTKTIFYEYNEYKNNEYKILSDSVSIKSHQNNYIYIANTSQCRCPIIRDYYIRKDNIIICSEMLYSFIKLGNYLKNKEFYELSYNEVNKESIVKIINMPNNYFNSFSISFDISGLEKHSFTVKLDINCDSNEDIFIKYYNGTEYIYTDQTVNDNIILKNFKYKYLIGFYKKSDKGEIKTSDMLKETNQFYWNINFNIKSYEIIINELEEIDTTLSKKIISYKKNENECIDNINNLLNFFKNKKIVVIPHITIKDNNEEIIPKYVNESRLKYMNFLKNTLSEIPNCYFFENYVINDMLEDYNHYNESGYKIIGDKLEKFLDEL